MADQNVAPVNATGANCFKEAVCIDAGRIYDSCTDRDCLTDLQVYFPDIVQPAIDNAVSVRVKEVEVLTAYLDVEPVPFNKGFYSVDITFFFKVTVCAYTAPAVPPTTVIGVAEHSKKVILYGSDGNVKVYNSTDPRNCSEHDNTNMPKASVHVVEPMSLDAKLVECTTSGQSCNNSCNNCCTFPSCICSKFQGNFGACAPQKYLLITLGLFTIVQLERSVQMMIPAYDYAVPDKAGSDTNSTDDPCELFKKIKFPVNQFFPPKFSENDQL